MPPLKVTDPRDSLTFTTVALESHRQAEFYLAGRTWRRRPATSVPDKAWMAAGA